MLKEINKILDLLLDYILIVSSSYFLSFLIGLLFKIENFERIWAFLICVGFLLHPMTSRYATEEYREKLKKPYGYFSKIVFTLGSIVVMGLFLNLYIKIFPHINFQSEIAKLELMLGPVFFACLSFIIFSIVVVRWCSFISEKIRQKLVAFIIGILGIGGLFYVLFHIFLNFLLGFSLVALHTSYLIQQIGKLLKVKGGLQPLFMPKEK